MHNISRSKDNQTMKFHELIEYNTRNIFLGKSCTKCSGETSPRPFSEESKLSISGLKIYTVCFYSMASWGLSKYIESKLQTTWFHLILSFFLKIKRILELVYKPHFLHNFWRKIFSCYILLIDQISLSGCFFFVRYWTICLLQLFVNQAVTSWISKLTLSF